jgi:hypothetical protein
MAYSFARKDGREFFPGNACPTPFRSKTFDLLSEKKISTICLKKYFAQKLSIFLPKKIFRPKTFDLFA